jgi:hypothetical protein
VLITDALLTTVRDILRDNLTHITETDKSIRITNDEKVPSYSGEEFINLYGCTVRNDFPLLADTRKEVYGVKIGITRRLIGIPTDQSAEAIYINDLISRTKSTMARRAYEIINLIDGSYGIPALINQMDWSDFPDFCVITPLCYSSSQEIEEKYAEHFYSEDDSERPQALFLELSFDGLEAYFSKYPIS